MNVAGIDAHTTYLVLVMVDSRGTKLEGPVRIELGEPDRLLAILLEAAPVEIVVETAPSWPWLYDLVAPYPEIRFVMAHAVKLRAIAEANYKRDEIDAELLARMRLAGLIPAVHAKSVEQRQQAVLIRHRQTLSRERTAVANRIHAQLHAVGLRLPRGRLLTKKGRGWIRERAWPLWGSEQRHLARTHFDLIDQLTAMQRSLDGRIEKVARTIPAAMLLQSIPGIGAYRALTIATEVLPISRFPTPGHLVGFAGLAPRTRQSGLAPIRHGRIPAGANRWLRGALVQAVVNHRGHDRESWLSKYYDTLKDRRGWQVARVATARKLARAIHAMLRTGEVWRSERDENGVSSSFRVSH
jgi:transposase